MSCHLSSALLSAGLVENGYWAMYGGIDIERNPYLSDISVFALLDYMQGSTVISGTALTSLNINMLGFEYSAAITITVNVQFPLTHHSSLSVLVTCSLTVGPDGGRDTE